MFAYCRNNPVVRIDITGTRDIDSNDDNDNLLKGNQRDGHGGGNGESRFSSHFSRPLGISKPWYTVIESSKAYNAIKGLKTNQTQNYEDALNQLAQGDSTGLNLHPSKGGYWSADISGFGRGRGNGRILFSVYEGTILIVDVTISHYK